VDRRAGRGADIRACDRVAHADENERNCRSSGADRDRVWRRRGGDDLWTKRDELSHERWDPLSPGLRVTILDLELLARVVADTAIWRRKVRYNGRRYGREYRPADR
jgi:hypothetical protein